MKITNNFILGEDGIKIYNIREFDEELQSCYSEFISNLIYEKAEEYIKKYFDFTEGNHTVYTEWAEQFTGFDNFLDIGISFINNKIVPRAFSTMSGKEYVYKNESVIKPEFRKKLSNKNIEVIFDEYAALSKDTPEDIFDDYFTKEDFLKLYDIFIVDLHLNKDSDLRGKASAIDTGLFDFKIK